MIEHIPVLREEVLEALCIREDGRYVDCTYGRGGHARTIAERLGPQGHLLAMDRDPEAVQAAREHRPDPRIEVVHAPFSMLAQCVVARGWATQVNGVLFDLGVSSPQLETAARGFSFLRDGPLDMRMDPTQGMTAAEWLAQASEEEIVECLQRYGEERYARRLARAVTAARKQAPVTGTAQLAAIIARAHPAWERGQHPATRAFQAIRMQINNELEELKQGLHQAVDVLVRGGRLVVISFHSLEDRIAKRLLRAESGVSDLPPDLPVCASAHPARLRLIGRPRRPGEDEVVRNPRARSATLRVAEKLA